MDTLALSLRVEINPAQSQLEACEAVVLLARRLGITVYAYANGTQVFASPDDTAEMVYTRFLVQSQKT
jgi:hypothetical protein